NLAAFNDCLGGVTPPSSDRCRAGCWIRPCSACQQGVVLMDETTWLTGADPAPMLDFLRDSGRASERRLRLFARACVPRAWEAVEDARSRRVVEVTEQYADGLATAEAWEAARDAAGAAARAGMAAGYAALYVADPAASHAAALTADPDATYYD